MGDFTTYFNCEFLSFTNETIHGLKRKIYEKDKKVMVSLNSVI
jgi:hypothetical protein